MWKMKLDRIKETNEITSQMTHSCVELTVSTASSAIVDGRRRRCHVIFSDLQTNDCIGTDTDGIIDNSCGMTHSLSLSHTQSPLNTQKQQQFHLGCLYPLICIYSTKRILNKSCVHESRASSKNMISENYVIFYYCNVTN